MKSVSKQIFLNSLVCPTLGWLLRSDKVSKQITETELTLGERFRIEQGIEFVRSASSKELEDYDLKEWYPLWGQVKSG